MEDYKKHLAEDPLDSDIIPDEVYTAAIEINTVLKKKYSCDTSGEVENLALRVKILSGIFTKKDFRELLDDVDISKCSILFDEEAQIITISSGILN